MATVKRDSTSRNNVKKILQMKVIEKPKAQQKSITEFISSLDKFEKKIDLALYLSK